MAKNKLYKALQQNKIKPQLKEIRGILGLSIGGSKVVDVPTRKGFVYVRIRDNQSEVIQAQNRTVSPIYDLPVTIVKDGLRWTIKGMDDGKYGNWASPAAYLPKHGYSHSLSRENGTGADPVWIYPDQFMPLLVYPSGTAGGLNVASYVLKTPTNWKYVGNTGTPNLLVHKPNSSGTVVGLVYMNTETGNPGYLIASGSLAYNNPTTIQGLVNYIPYPASNQEPLYVFTMTSGTSGIGWENIFNVRQFFGNLITGSGGSGTTVTVTGSFPYIELRDVKSVGTNAGDITANTWTARTVNTEVYDTSNLCSISSNQITLAAGTYDMDCVMSFFGTRATGMRLRNITDNSTAIIGNNLDSYDYGASGHLRGRFTIAAQKTFEIQAIIQQNQGAGYGMGVAVDGGASNYDEDEVYLIARFWKV